MNKDKREKIGANSNYKLTNVFDPHTFDLSYINCELRLSKTDLTGDDEAILSMFEDIAIQIINSKKNI